MKMNTMNKKLKYIILGGGLLVFWIVPLVFVDPSLDSVVIKAVLSYLLFLAAVSFCHLLPNRHAALIVTVVLGIVICVLQPIAVFDIMPAMLLCCWLRCYLEYKNGNPVTVYLELFTDLLYVYLIAAVIRLTRHGYSLVQISVTCIQVIPDICLMMFVLLLFSVFFFFGTSSEEERNSPTEKRKKNLRRAERKMVGTMPVLVSLRTFWAFCALCLATAFLQYINGNLIEESALVFRTGFRLLFLPWLVLLFISLAVFSPKLTQLKIVFVVDDSKGDL